ncbi:MAG: AI-2E family transporter [Pseudomonadales bacterium]|jgi:predicted PurR-regulated permease PerM|nr:AI-2E family transporter [Pseudomonadales bacterium]
MSEGRGLRVLLTLAALMIVLAGMRAAVNIVVPFILAVFIATIAATPMFWMQRHGVPKALALIAVILLIVVGGMVLGSLIGSSAREFTDAIPFYEQRLRALVADGITFLQGFGLEVTREMLPNVDPGFAMRMAGRTLSGLTGVLSNTFLILLTVVFMLLEAHAIPRKLTEILPDPEESLPRFASFTETINRYMAIKTTISALTGLLVYVLNAAMGVDFAVLWGLLAFLLNYVPNIGSFIAAVPPVLLAAVQLGLGEAAFLGVAYFGLNFVVGGMVEPRFMGQGLGLSTLVVWLSLVFWGWVLGPVGMLLSVPLTVTLRIALEHRPDTHWIAVMLGPNRELPDLALAGPSPSGADPASPEDPPGPAS